MKGREVNRRQCLAAMAAPWFTADIQTPLWKGDATGDFSARGDELVKTVRDHFYDPKTAKEWADRHAALGKGAKDEDDFKRIVGDALRDLNASHTAYYTPSDARYYGLAAIFRELLPNGTSVWDSPGADFTHDGFVRRVFAGGPADQAGLRRGDRVLRADGKPFHPVNCFRGRAGQPSFRGRPSPSWWFTNRPVWLEVLRKEKEPVLNIPIIPRRIDAKEEWLQAQGNGSKVMSRGGKKIAYVPMFSCAGEEHEERLRDSLRYNFGAADALVVDFREGFGGCNTTFLNFLFRSAPVMEQAPRGKPWFKYDSQWRKPFVLLVNERSTSGKEMIAFTVKKRRLGTIVGKRTAGALLAGGIFPLMSRALLYLAVADVRIDGERLEGKGVEPDVEVEEALPFANGADPQLEKALEVAAKMARDGTSAR